jgi:hypothetical protein
MLLPDRTLLWVMRKREVVWVPGPEDVTVPARNMTPSARGRRNPPKRDPEAPKGRQAWDGEIVPPPVIWTSAAASKRAMHPWGAVEVVMRTARIWGVTRARAQGVPPREKET